MVIGKNSPANVQSRVESILYIKFILPRAQDKGSWIMRYKFQANMTHTLCTTRWNTAARTLWKILPKIIHSKCFYQTQCLIEFERTFSKRSFKKLKVNTFLVKFQLKIVANGLEPIGKSMLSEGWSFYELINFH